ncbi:MULTISPECIES: hypothetical protein [unclassified Paenibacillus]|uniref:hypothetical protein n=1 Tax=unclassified Paenibacillus TaxID=185978 RepID=UPI00147E3CCC|nr:MULTISPECIES: hypothetical protein [unclassified Paenibacillus]
MINRRGYLVNNKGKLEGYISALDGFSWLNGSMMWSTFEATNVNLNKPTEG